MKNFSRKKKKSKSINLYQNLKFLMKRIKETKKNKKKKEKEKINLMILEKK